MSFDLDIGYATLAGRGGANEDFAGALAGDAGEDQRGAIAAIADGVSTGGMGREAAQTTVTSLVRDYFGTPATWDTTVALDRVIAAQNAWLVGINRRRAPALGLTTLTALVLRGQSYALAHVGDTRAYLLRGGALELLSADHVVAHPDFSHQLTRSVGADDRLVVDYRQGEVQAGDLFVLLTDGVHGSLPEREIAALARAAAGDGPPHDAPSGARAQSIAQGLVAAARQRGSSDDATALVLRVRGVATATLHDATLRARELPVPPALKVGDAIDGLTVTALVSDSGVARLYQVRDGATRRLYALKTVHPRRAHDAEERATLAHEGWLARRMQGGRAADHLVRLRDGPPGGPSSAFYLLYDWHGGDTWQQLLDRGQRPAPAQAVALALQVARTLGQLHRQGVVHRDIKPSNLHQGDDGSMRVLDLGVALSGREPAATRALHAGTPSYVNPEQWDDPPQPVDARSDLFALGVTLYQLLTGALPYGEVVPYQRGRYWRDPLPPSRRNPAVPIWLDHVVLKAVARDAAQRFETAEELVLALERGASRPVTAPPPTPLVARDPAALWKIGLAVSLLLNALLVYWLLFLPR
jgi:serine/threonine protein phosphatase PrpC